MSKIALLQNPNVEEVLGADDLDHLITTKTPLEHYIGFEISGQVHVGSGLITMSVIKDIIEMGGHPRIFLADWHSWINNKLGGDRELIRKVAIDYFKEAMIASAIVLGVDHTKIDFPLGTELYETNPQHWANLIEASKHTTLARVKRSIDIMGRKAGDVVNFASLIYPPLQVADIFTMQLNVVHAGMDQRKAHVLARQVAKKMTIMPIRDSKGEVIKPVAVHHKLLPSILTPPKWPMTPEEIKTAIADMKMSKSRPEGAIFITDEPAEIQRKVLKAFCPAKDLSYNPIVTWIEMLVFAFGNELEVKRPEKWGGNLTIKDKEQLHALVLDDGVHPQDLKQGLADYLVEFLKPARDYFADKDHTAALEFVKKLTITR